MVSCRIAVDFSIFAGRNFQLKEEHDHSFTKVSTHWLCTHDDMVEIIDSFGKRHGVINIQFS